VRKTPDNRRFKQSRGVSRQAGRLCAKNCNSIQELNSFAGNNRRVCRKSTVSKEAVKQYDNLTKNLGSEFKNLLESGKGRN